MIENFIDSISEKSWHTKTTYKTVLVKLEEFFLDRGASFTKYIKDDIQDYVYYLERDVKMQPSSVQLHLRVISLFFKFLGDPEATKRIRYIKPVEDPTPKSLNKNEMNALKRDTKKDPRLDAIVRLFLSCGFRVEELHSLNVSSITFGRREESNIIRFIRKGNKEGKVNFRANTKQTIEKWLAVREEMVMKFHRAGKDFDQEALFLSNQGKRLSKRAIQADVEALGEKNGFTGEEKLHCHMLRHTCFTMMLDDGASLSDIRAISGHSEKSASMLLRYTKSSPAKASGYAPD